jgi:hypothetical protein
MNSIYQTCRISLSPVTITATISFSLLFTTARNKSWLYFNNCTAVAHYNCYLPAVHFPDLSKYKTALPISLSIFVVVYHKSSPTIVLPIITPRPKARKTATMEALILKRSTVTTSIFIHDNSMPKQSYLRLGIHQCWLGFSKGKSIPAQKALPVTANQALALRGIPCKC